MRRKLFALITTVLLLVSMAVPALADSIPRGSDTFAGDLYLVASNDSFLSGYPGHAFIVYKNTSYYSVQIGDMTIPSGEEVTLGTTNAETVKYGGVWYNLEAYSYHEKDEFISNVYLHTTVTLMDIVTINDYINDWPKYYDLVLHNCVHFARGMWYDVTGESFSCITPADLMSEIILDNSHGSCLVLAEQEDVGYYVNGEFQHVH